MGKQKYDNQQMRAIRASKRRNALVQQGYRLNPNTATKGYLRALRKHGKPSEQYMAVKKLGRK